MWLISFMVCRCLSLILRHDYKWSSSICAQLGTLEKSYDSCGFFSPSCLEPGDLAKVFYSQGCTPGEGIAMLNCDLILSLSYQNFICILAFIYLEGRVTHTHRGEEGEGERKKKGEREERQTDTGIICWFTSPDNCNSQGCAHQEPRPHKGLSYGW